MYFALFAFAQIIMGGSASRQVCDAVASPGYPASLTGDRLANMQNLAQRAANTFPPPFIHPTGDEPFVPTVEGNRAMSIGAAAVARAPKVLTSNFAIFSSFPFSRQRTEEELGGIDGIFTLFACLYRRMFEDPRMRVLFDTRHDDTNVSALEHGKRIGSAMSDQWFGTSFYPSLKRDSSRAAIQIGPSHGRAKQCPMRPREHRRSGMFTVAQRNTWLGYAWMGAEDIGTSEEFREKMIDWIAGNLGFMGQFLDEDA
jgi:hypothetical protein